MMEEKKSLQLHSSSLKDMLWPIGVGNLAARGANVISLLLAVSEVFHAVFTYVKNQEAEGTFNGFGTHSFRLSEVLRVPVLKPN
jgi:hypothetical protein